MRDVYTKNNNISEVVKLDLCTGCGTCVSVCPVECIQMQEDIKKGIYVPQVDESKCIYCGLCLKVCPGLSINFDLLNMQIFNKIPANNLLGNYIHCYIGYSVDHYIRYNSSSGGLITALLCFMLEENIIDGALVTVMDCENPLRPRVILATSRKEIISSSGSKYCPVPLNASLKKVLKLNGSFAMVGLPCHVHGVRKFAILNERIKEKIKYIFGLFCANTVTFLGTEYFLGKYNIRKNDISKIRYRGEGWPGFITVTTKDGTRYKIRRGPSEKNLLYKAIYSSAFHYDFIPYRCLLCPDQTNLLADISFGDAWLPELLRFKSAGFSVVVSRTKKGQEILNKALKRKVIKLIKIDEKTFSRTGNFRFKSHVGGRIQILKRLKKPVPFFIEKNLRMHAGIIDYLHFLFYLPSFISERRGIWRILPIIALFRTCISKYIKLRIS